jgi:hypothetical protein
MKNGRRVRARTRVSTRSDVSLALLSMIVPAVGMTLEKREKGYKGRAMC